MDPANQPQVSRAGRLMTARIIWGAMLMGQIMFLAIIVLVIWANARPEQRLDDDLRRILLYAGVGMLVSGVLVGYLLRSKIAAPGSDGLIDGGRYFTGNILLWAMMEGASLFGLVMMMLDQKAWPFLGIVIVAMAVQAINFPTGNGMK
jgi:F0F1-type ATP synthase membrane subunit c/vacuolar-type H+-ATPase subunit K